MQKPLPFYIHFRWQKARNTWRERHSSIFLLFPRCSSLRPCPHEAVAQGGTEPTLAALQLSSTRAGLGSPQPRQVPVNSSPKSLGPLEWQHRAGRDCLRDTAAAAPSLNPAVIALSGQRRIPSITKGTHTLSSAWRTPQLQEIPLRLENVSLSSWNQHALTFKLQIQLHKSRQVLLVQSTCFSFALCKPSFRGFFHHNQNAETLTEAELCI